MHDKKRRRSGLQRGFWACIIGEIAKSRCVSYFSTVPNVRASASLPLVSRNVKIGDAYYLDGGIADAIPIRKAIADGNLKNVVILTKEVGYIRKQVSPVMLNLIKFKYAKFPKVYELTASRYVRYNETMRFLEEEEKAGKVFVIRPQKANDIGRIEKDREKLEVLYQLGYQDAKKCWGQLMNFLQIECII